MKKITDKFPGLLSKKFQETLKELKISRQLYFKSSLVGNDVKKLFTNKVNICTPTSVKNVSKGKCSVIFLGEKFYARYKEKYFRYNEKYFRYLNERVHILFLIAFKDNLFA